ncbi:MAG: hypothetical protein GEV12_08435 [Micromonosporaceae bacterium]|nr:hypothetical protein [Micromonosporaceae bacterium]
MGANSTNLTSLHLAGVTLRQLLEQHGWSYGDGCGGPPAGDRTVSECYPYTILVGAAELGYAAEGHCPRYKRKPVSVPVAQRRPQRAAACDELVRRPTQLASADPPVVLDSRPVARQLVEEVSPICAWTAALWHGHGLVRCEVRGPAHPVTGSIATIIAPAIPDQ